ncbi:MAG: hypothetical protein IAE91_09840 [Ignavibacteriaceae bacterium]|nr:hypothetical protein [Ignavibacteriaceae bacterium]
MTFGTAPYQYIVLALLGGGTLCILGIVFVFMSAIRKMNGSRRRWLEPILPAIVFLLLGGAIIYAALQFEPYNDRLQEEFDESIDILSFIEEFLK